jgi:H+/Cl- antiporter ClcA
MTGIFGTPFASIMLAVELLLFEWKPRSFVPVVTAVLVALAWRPLLVGAGPLFPFGAPTPTGLEPVAISAALGLVTGVLAAVLSFLLYRIEDGFHALPIHWMWWPAIGAVVVGIGGLFDLRVLGAGYDNIQALLDGNLVVKAVILLLVVKAIVWLVALGSGTSGGILAPLLILGGCAGFLMGQYLPGDPGFWAMIGMAGIMSGVMRAPMTGALFAAELTNHLGPAGNDRRGDRRLCNQRADHEALDPHRKDCAARASRPSRIYGRSARVPAGLATHEREPGDASWRHAGR